MVDVLSMHIKEKIIAGEKESEPKPFKIDKEEIKVSQSFSLKNITHAQVFKK